MKNKKILLTTIVSILLSPLLGGIIGRVIGWTDLLNYSHLYLEEGLSYIGAIAWIIASVIYYVDQRNE